MSLLYRLDTTAPAVAAQFGARAGDDPWSGGYVSPGRFAPVITAGREFIAGPRPAGKALAPRMVPRLWGVPPPPSSDDSTRTVPTVRNPDSPFWIGHLRNSEFRCLVPATSFMEWGSATDYEGRRLRHWFAPVGPPLFAMAGVWKDEDVPGFAVLTVKAAGLPGEFGCKSMPVLVAGEGDAQQAWLHGGWDSARAVLANASQIELVETNPDAGIDEPQ